jgi:hypothetical protein
MRGERGGGTGPGVLWLLIPGYFGHHGSGDIVFTGAYRIHGVGGNTHSILFKFTSQRRDSFFSINRNADKIVDTRTNTEKLSWMAPRLDVHELPVGCASKSTHSSSSSTPKIAKPGYSKLLLSVG